MKLKIFIILLLFILPLASCISSFRGVNSTEHANLIKTEDVRGPHPYIHQEISKNERHLDDDDDDSNSNSNNNSSKGLAVGTIVLYCLPIIILILIPIFVSKFYLRRPLRLRTNLHVITANTRRNSTVETVPNLNGAPGITVIEVRQSYSAARPNGRRNRRVRRQGSAGLASNRNAQKSIKELPPKFDLDLKREVATNEDEQCKICFFQKSNVMLLPCEHDLCHLCLKQISICPFCRADIKDVQVLTEDQREKMANKKKEKDGKKKKVQKKSLTTFSVQSVPDIQALDIHQLPLQID